VPELGARRQSPVPEQEPGPVQKQAAAPVPVQKRAPAGRQAGRWVVAQEAGRAGPADCSAPAEQVGDCSVAEAHWEAVNQAA